MKETVKNFAEAAEAKVLMLKNSFARYFVLSMMAGIYVGFGIILIFSVGAPLKAAGVASAPGLKALMGVSFGVALTLVIFAGSELFTGNNMIMTIGSLSKKVSWADTIRLWAVCFVGNLAGALLLSFALSLAGTMNNGMAHDFITTVALKKAGAPFMQLFFRAILCNMLVCLAVWMPGRTNDDTAKIFLIFWCLFAFIGSGFEHSIANMTVIGVGHFISPEKVTWAHLLQNLIPVTLGNMVGGGFFIGAAYWFVSSTKAVEKEKVLEEGKTSGVLQELVLATEEV